ncbi:hypothetical protein JXA80_02205, partial [bacterium]|nr:hypothetical protein [candidate division CSSED10-310 bacterium]
MPPSAAMTDVSACAVSRRVTWKVITAGLLVAICWFALMMFPVESFDVYYHLATGRWIIDNGSIPRHDIFSTTAAGTPWITHEWAAQAGLYLAYRILDFDFLIVAKSVSISLGAFLLFHTGYHMGLSVPWIVLLMSCAAPGIAFRAFLRPHLLSYGFLALLLVL